MGRQGEEEDEAHHGRYGHREEDAPGAGHAGADGLLGHVRRGVVAGVGPVRLEQREEEGENQREGLRCSVLEAEDRVVLPGPPRWRERVVQLPAASSGWMAKSVRPDWSGLPVRKMKTTTAATMAMCHQTLTWLRSATRLMPAMFMSSWMSMSTPIVTSWPLSTPGMNSVVLPNPGAVKRSMIAALRKPAAA